MDPEREDAGSGWRDADAVRRQQSPIEEPASTAHQYHIRGVTVDFPHAAYDCQQLYMEKVLQAVQRSEHALLESPTGTGKSQAAAMAVCGCAGVRGGHADPCLLCAVQPWRCCARPSRGARSFVNSTIAARPAAATPTPLHF